MLIHFRNKGASYLHNTLKELQYYTMITNPYLASDYSKQQFFP